MSDSALPRRDVLGVLAGLGLTVMNTGPSVAKARRRRIDIHYHAMAPAWLEIAQEDMPPDIRAIAKAWTPEVALAAMDKADIETAICSISNPGIWFGDVAQSRKLARACNDYMAGMVADHPTRFGMFAALPLPDVEGSLAELAYAFDTLKADGVALFTSYGTSWIADPKYAPVFQELNRRKAVVYVHPTAPACCQKLVPGVPAVLMEFTADTSRAILQWMMTKSSALYPDLHMIFSHSGGLFMAGVGRLQVLADTQPEIKLPTDIGAEAAKLYYEFSSAADKPTMDLLRSYVPASHIMLGTDAPFIKDVARNLGQFDRLRLTPGERSAMERDNAVRLMPRFGKPGAA